MPIHLNTLSRRRFLGAAAALTVSPSWNAFAAAGAKGTETWALLSDTQIEADPATASRQGITMAETLKRVVAEVAAEAKSLQGVIIDGDCAYNEGLPGDYATLAKLLTPLTDAGLPIHMTLGNHDDRGPFYEAFSTRAPRSRPVEGKHISVIETALASWILLDSLRYVNKVEGEFGESQLEWLAGYLDAHPGKHSLIVGHHYPQVAREDVIPTKGKHVKISGLIDSAPFLELLAARPQAKAYIFGHSHDWRVTRDDSGIHHINLPPTSYVFNPERPNGWVRATLTREDLTLQLIALDQKHPEHGDTHHLTWRT